MKKFLFLAFTFIYGQIYAQDIQFEYEYTKSLDSINSKTQHYILEYHKNYHYFYGKDTYALDSLSKVNDTRIVITHNMKIPVSKKKQKRDILKNFLYEDGKDYFMISNFTVLKIKYEDKINLDWKLEENTIEYLGYICNQATTEYAGRRYIAWYTKKIPISAGPYVFRGLPGLIVKISDTENKHVFRLTEIKKTLNNFSTEGYKLIAKEKAKELQTNIENDPIQMLLPDFQPTPETKKRLDELKKRNFKKDTNPIELID
ncbi:GLPGLI family protein [Frigoriflavimonas asaccharolytica]|uniref:GLPGLI family protein n=1 Tax=Frigoriflavimonas asaccharolytica TaxID=2735899 RepID=A0A8J8K982_9FLAO|nr:GLPGLI family protein [Frigoriflavimonas asaccharolytica]NRS93331.1 GLPGLI family protein [Frigoriflavimonas asaccharolytica]